MKGFAHGAYAPSCPGPGRPGDDECGKPRAQRGRTWLRWCEAHVKQKQLHPDRPLQPLRRTYRNAWERVYEAIQELVDRTEADQDLEAAKERFRLAAKAWLRRQTR